VKSVAVTDQIAPLHAFVNHNDPRGEASHFMRSSITERNKSGKVDPRVRALDKKRKILGWSHEEFCGRAGATIRNWHYLRAGAHPPSDRSLKKFEAALKGHDARKGIKPSAVFSLHRAVMTLLCVFGGEDPQVLVNQDFSVERAADPLWGRAAYMRGLATYICAVELQIENVVLAEAIGVERQAVHQRRIAIEDLRERDARANALIETVTPYVRASHA